MTLNVRNGGPLGLLQDKASADMTLEEGVICAGAVLQQLHSQFVAMGL